MQRSTREPTSPMDSDGAATRNTRSICTTTGSLRYARLGANDVLERRAPHRPSRFHGTFSVSLPSRPAVTVTGKCRALSASGRSWRFSSTTSPLHTLTLSFSLSRPSTYAPSCAFRIAASRVSNIYTTSKNSCAQLTDAQEDNSSASEDSL